MVRNGSLCHTKVNEWLIRLLVLAFASMVLMILVELLVFKKLAENYHQKYQT